jgi:hypothetical protein
MNAHGRASNAIHEPETAVTQNAVHGTAIMLAAVNAFRSGLGSGRLVRTVMVSFPKRLQH